MGKEITLVESAARTVTTVFGVDENFMDFIMITAELDVTAASGTSPTLDVIIEDTSGNGNWRTIGTFAQKTTTGNEVIEIFPKDSPAAGFAATFRNQLRVTATIGGTTPSFTFSLKGTVR